MSVSQEEDDIKAMIDEEYDMQIEMPTFKTLKTLGAIAEYIEKNK